jgi:isocitrate dehydrogenase kinase/phosphatase
MFGRARFRDVIGRQLDLFEREHADVVREAQERLELYNAAPRDEAEELYGDYVDALETGTEILADLRDHFARTLEEADAERYEREFNAAVAKRLRPFALDLENR